MQSSDVAAMLASNRPWSISRIIPPDGTLSARPLQLI
jgi:hypothetical protein